MLITSYDAKTFARKSTLTKVKSIIINKRLYDLGSFELSANKCDFEVGDIILYENYGFICHKIVKTLTSIKLYGYDLKGLAYQRYTDTETIYTNKTAEYIIKDFASKYLNTGDRKIIGFEIATNSGAGDVIPTYTVEKGKRMSDILKTICQTFSIGYDITFDETKFVFDTIPETENDNITFSRTNRNINEIEYTKSVYDYANVIYHPDESGNIQIDGTETGISRYEGYSTDDVTAYKSEHQIEETLKGTANGRNEYGTDYKLGDIVTVIFNDVSTQKTITEIEIADEPSRHSIVPTFGTEKENPIKKMIRG